MSAISPIYPSSSPPSSSPPPPPGETPREPKRGDIDHRDSAMAIDHHDNKNHNNDKSEKNDPWEDLLRKMLPAGAPLPDEEQLDFSFCTDWPGPPTTTTTSLPIRGKGVSRRRSRGRTTTSEASPADGSTRRSFDSLSRWMIGSQAAGRGSPSRRRSVSSPPPPHRRNSAGSLIRSRSSSTDHRDTNNHEDVCDDNESDLFSLKSLSIRYNNCSITGYAATPHPSCCRSRKWEQSGSSSNEYHDDHHPCVHGGADGKQPEESVVLDDDVNFDQTIDPVSGIRGEKQQLKVVRFEVEDRKRAAAGLRKKLLGMCRHLRAGGGGNDGNDKDKGKRVPH